MAAEEWSLSIAQWCALARRGAVLPMRIPLDGDSMRPLRRGDAALVDPRCAKRLVRFGWRISKRKRAGV